MSTKPHVAECPVCNDSLDDPTVTAKEWRTALHDVWCERCWGPVPRKEEER